MWIKSCGSRARCAPSRYRMLGGLSVLLTPTRMVVVAPGRVAEGVAPKMSVLACMLEGLELKCTVPASRALLF